jgi:hypothetical protein
MAALYLPNRPANDKWNESQTGSNQWWFDVMSWWSCLYDAFVQGSCVVLPLNYCAQIKANQSQ